MVTFKDYINEALGIVKGSDKPYTKVAGEIEKEYPKYPPEEQSRRETLRTKAMARLKGDPSTESVPDFLKLSFADEILVLLKRCYKSLDALDSGQKPTVPLIWGDPGVGKSEIMADFTRYIQKQLEQKEGRQRKLIKFDNIKTRELKQQILDNPSAYIVFFDVRLSQKTISSLEGLPEIRRGAKSTSFELLPEDWIAFTTSEGAAGLLFFDEVNTAPPDIRSLLYGIINDRKFGNATLAREIMIAAAGNLGAAFEGASDLSPVIATRFGIAYMIADPVLWFKYAEENNINTKIIDFVKDNPEDNFFKLPIKSGGQMVPSVAWPNPRNIVRFSQLLDGIDNEFERVLQEVQSGKVTKEQAAKFDYINEVRVAASANCGEVWANKFITFLEEIEAYDLEAEAASLKTDADTIPENKQAKLTTVLIKKIVNAVDQAGDSTKQVPFGKDGAKMYDYNYDALNSSLQPIEPVVSRLYKDQQKLLLVLRKLKKSYPDICKIYLSFLSKDQNKLQLLAQLYDHLKASSGNVQI